MSRNKQQGRYAGKFRGMHFRQSGVMMVRKQPRTIFAARELMLRNSSIDFRNKFQTSD